MQATFITKEEFDALRSNQRRGKRVELINQIKELLNQKENKGRIVRINFDSPISKSNWQHVRKTLTTTMKNIKELKYVANKENTKQVEAFTASM